MMKRDYYVPRCLCKVVFLSAGGETSVMWSRVDLGDQSLMLSAPDHGLTPAVQQVHLCQPGPGAASHSHMKINSVKMISLSK